MKYKCPKCGEIFEGELKSCPKCGRKFKYAESASKDDKLAVSSKAVDTSKESYFDGFTIQYIGWSLLGALLTIVTLGICYPLALGMIERWKAEHTVINGYRLRFDGSAGSLIPRWILWMFLTIITLGIFGLTLPVRLEKWKASRLVLVPEKK